MQIENWKNFRSKSTCFFFLLSNGFALNGVTKKLDAKFLSLQLIIKFLLPLSVCSPCHILYTTPILWQWERERKKITGPGLNEQSRQEINRGHRQRDHTISGRVAKVYMMIIRKTKIQVTKESESSIVVISIHRLWWIGRWQWQEHRAIITCKILATVTYKI